MRKIFLFLLVSFIAVINLTAQKIIPIEHNGQKYEVLDMIAKGKVMWGGYNEEIEGAKSQSDGAVNTKAIVTAVGKNTGFGEKPYAAKLCSEATGGGKDDWYLPSKEEVNMIYAIKDKFKMEERGSIWTSTEANASQSVTKYWYTGDFYNNMKVDEFHFVCIRKAE